MSKPAVVDRYQKRYVDPRFERRGLFELIQETYAPQEVLYPGCSIHVAPSFFFPHVVFVDRDPMACEFFSDTEAVLDLIKRHRTYRRMPHIEFLAQDFTQPLPLRQGQFDLLLGLFAGGVARACWPYLRVGGILVTNDHQGDALDALQDKELALAGIAEQRRGKYRLIAAERYDAQEIERRAIQSRRYLRRTDSGFEYVEHESYYIFRRTRPRSP